ncbi:MAG: type IV pilus secretin PilQ [Deltaproteobacteria bacterium]|nr:type IV pilus secretin PilQ [Deltaproteobacteria bacterium]
MFYKKSLRRENIISLLIIFSLTFLVFSCAQAPVKKEVAGIIEEKPTQIEAIKVISDPSDEKTMIEITSSKLISYAAFKLVQPLRLIVDLNAFPAQGLTSPGVINDRLVKGIHFEKIKGMPVSTRLIATLIQDVEYNVREEDKTVRFLLSAKKTSEIEKRQLPSLPAEGKEMAAKEPRLYFLPSKTQLNQILGVDFYMLPKGKSRITVTTTKKADYDLSRKKSLTLLLEIMDCTIPSELTRYLNSSLFKGAVNQITPIVKVAEKQVDLEIELKEMVPYHMIQTDKEIRLDFSKTSVKPPIKQITQTRLGKGLVKPAEVPSETLVKSEKMRPHVVKAAVKPAHITTTYTGARMTLDFADADIRNILKLIGEISKRNIVWGSEVKGTVSMRLKNVPWDQALGVVLDVNKLGMIVDGNIIRVMTKEAIKALEQEKEARLKAERERIKAVKTEQKAAVAEEPLITDYITVNYVEVDAIKTLIEENVKGPRGRLSVDKSNKTIIITDTADNIQKAKALKQRQDRPIKQVMIEARIVEASTGFTRNIGVEWGMSYQKTGNPWGGSGPATVSYDFATNFAMPSATTAGLIFSNTAGTKVLNAQIALAETENKAKTLSAPKIITRDTKTATIKQGTKIVIPSGTDDSGNKTYEQVDATLKLEVTPNITPNNMVILDIDVSDDYPDYSQAIGDNVPIKTKNAKTQMMVASGDTVIIGGIYKETTSHVEEGVPWLSKIPIFGWLFKREEKKKEKSELLIFITPTVLPVGKKGGN